MKNKRRKTRTLQRISLAELSAQLESPHVARWLKASRAKKTPPVVVKDG